METVLTIFIISALLTIITLYYLMKKNKPSLKTENDVQVIRAKYIIKHKELFTKLQIQKAQQFLDNVKLN